MKQQDKYVVTNEILDDMEARIHWLPVTPNESIGLTRERFQLLRRRKIFPNENDMKDILTILKMPYTNLQKEAERKGNEELRYEYWNLLYPEYEPRERLSLVLEVVTMHKQMSYSDVARNIDGTSISYLLSVVSGKTSVTFDYLERYAKAINVSTSEILDKLITTKEISTARKNFCELLRKISIETDYTTSELCAKLHIKESTFSSICAIKCLVKEDTLNAFEKVFRKEDVLLLKQYAIEGEFLKTQASKTKKTYQQTGLEGMLQNMLRQKKVLIKVPDAVYSTSVRSRNFYTLISMILQNDWTQRNRCYADIRYYLSNYKNDENLAGRLRTFETSTEQFRDLRERRNYSYSTLRAITGYSSSGMSGAISSNRDIAFELAWKTCYLLNFPICLAYDDRINEKMASNQGPCTIRSIQSLIDDLETKDSWEYKAPVYDTEAKQKFEIKSIKTTDLVTIIKTIFCSSNVNEQMEKIEAIMKK